MPARKSLASPFLLILLIVGIGCGPDPSREDEPSIDVGVYIGEGVFAPSVRASIEAIRANYSFDTLTAEDLVNGGIYRFRAVLMPGGDQHIYSDYFGPVARSIIREYVRVGGGYIGFGAGGGLAASDSIDWPGIGLIAAVTAYPLHQIAPPPFYVLTDVVRGDYPGPIEGALFYRTLYYSGPQFIPFRSENLWISYRYQVTGGVAAITAVFGAGHVFAAGFQPEFEEGSSRDSVDFADDLLDPESEWSLIREAVRYCLAR